MVEVRKARHVPVEVEYVELTDSNGPEVADWCGGEWVFGALLVPTIIGQVRPTPDASWLIVKGTQGEYYPVRADVFARVYEDGQGDGRDWLAVREWLIKAKARADAEGFLGAEMLTAALVFMDQQERQALR